MEDNRFFGSFGSGGSSGGGGGSTEATIVYINGKKDSAGTIAKGLPVYLVGYDSDIHTVELANANSGSTMPVIGFTNEPFNNTDSKKIITFGKLEGVDTTSTVSTLNPNGETWVVNDALYMNSTAGGLTKVRPTGTNFIQRIAKVLRVDASGGQIFIFNTARTAGLPNLTTDNVWVGDANGYPQMVNKSTLGGNAIDTADGTIGSGRIATVTDTLTYKGIGTSLGQRNLIITDINNDYILENYDNGYFKRTIRSGNNLGVIQNGAGTQGLWIQTSSELAGVGGLLIKNAKADTNYLKYYTDNFKAPDAQWYSNGAIHHRIRSNGTSSTVLSQVSFFTQGFFGFGFNVGASEPIGTENISLQGETVIKGINTLSTSTALAIYDGDGTPLKLWDFTNDGGLIGYASKTSLIAQNATSNDINEYIFRLRNSADNANYFFVGNGGEVRLGKQATDNSTGDKSTNNLWGEVVTKSGSGGYATLIGGNITANYTGERVVGLGRYIDITKERTVGIGGSVTISGDYSNGIGNGVTLGQFSHGVGTFISASSNRNNLFGSFLDVTAQGAGVWGYGVNTANDLVNSTADSLALGWNSTTPQHLFFQTGAYIGGNSAIGTEDISLQGSVLIDGTLDMNNNRITNAVVNPSVQETTSTATFTINADEETDGVLTAMATNTTIASPTGTPVQSQSLIFRFKDDGTSRTLTWNAIFRAIGVTLPTATTANKLLYVGCKYNSTDTKWDVVSVQEEA
jgi:hypothetical protein